MTAMSELSEIKDQLTAIRNQLDEQLRRFDTHEARHEALAETQAELRSAVFGVGPESGLKFDVQGIKATCANRACVLTPWQQIAMDAASAFLSNGLLAFVLWLLLVYRNIH